MRRSGVIATQTKWLTQVRGDDTIASAARKTLKLRLRMVEKLLKRASRDGPFQDPEVVHQLRVCSRRSLAAIEIYQSVLPSKELRWFRRRLRQIRKAAGIARDLDVFLIRYQNDPVLKKAGAIRFLKKKRRKAQRPIQTLYEKLVIHQRFRKKTQRLLRRISTSSASDDPCFAKWSRGQLTATAADFFDQVPREPYDLEALHRFRVQGKRLRYTMESLASAFPPPLRSTVYPRVTELQNKLGQLNDHATACRSIKRWSKEAKKRKLRDCFDGLISLERCQLDDSIACFRKWWTPEFASRLETALHAMAADDRDASSRHRSC